MFAKYGTGRGVVAIVALVILAVSFLVVGAHWPDPMLVFNLETNELAKEIPKQLNSVCVEFNAAGDVFTVLAVDGTITDFSVKKWEKVGRQRGQADSRFANML